MSTLSFGISALVHVGCLIAIVAVVATVARRHRPDAYGSLLAWAISALVWCIVEQVAYMAIPMVASMLGDSIDMILGVQMALHLFGSFMGVVLAVLFIRGIVKIVQPPRGVPNDPVGPYR